MENSSAISKGFIKISSQIDVSVIMMELLKNRRYWYVNQNRQKKIKVQSQTNSIGLRRAAPRAGQIIRLEDVHDSEDTELAANFPKTMALLRELAAADQGRLARANLVRLRPSGRVLGHVDEGDYYACRDRYHLVLQSPAGSEMVCDGERVVWQVGELWCFNNKGFHEAYNKAADWRIHLIFDLEPIGRPLHFLPDMIAPKSIKPI